MAEPIFDRLAIVGAGLIGSSIARAARDFGAARKIAMLDASEQVMARVRELGLADEAGGDAAQALKGADLIIICTPVGVCGAVAEAIAPYLEKGAILSDVGSVKGAVVAQIAPHLPAGVHFIPAHPLAGTEFSGPDAGFATLFQNRWSILTPLEGADVGAVERLADFWARIGAKVETMSPEHHDKVLALTSHLPHLIAYNIVGTADDFGEQTRSEVIKFSASGFRDFTRIAASDPTMWRDIFLNNREAVLEMLGRFNEDLSALQRMIRRGDGEGLFDFFSRTRAIRRSIVEQGQDTSAPDFGRR
ncbi:prephenate/arogenate dehydrogenase family protein [Methylocystis sp. MJC1]|jgi:cyclohexadieny/prephenate dehydrogenase|uniref:prephenate/arogenate dehydrogenase family protein n=1 Tax=Methylocystis sp. MJC1 TaxID=2654282 RepID=UPI0013EC7043|nr:prephenate/arogenate dehydrogenase family protein [Methylocystis sp. MJC1]KAF2990382.1 Prephenate dehydrogenase [Methylocystis sp. MJC1]MBU6528176.1 prephenate/arogenate dehydrogenase family protein [Methylocystis sp. MJC1]UZX11087.1 prephenate/arogenate dehydrogenase family protein [Methylocystis sp. MJC1]